MLLHRNISLFSFLFMSLLLSFNTSAEDGRTDYDIDDDGLIEINDLQDLNEIRNHLDGTTLYGENSGCPEVGCTGFEITTDLDFDTNQDGVIDADDLYWNEGLGWEPIGNGNVRFTTIFDGNGHVIRNLFINRPDSDYIGLFGYLYGASAEVRQIGLTGPLMEISGSQYVGSIAGRAYSGATIKQTFSTGAVIGSRYAGGLIGRIDTANVSQSFSTGSTTGNSEVGGLLGYANDSVIRSNFATGFVSGTSLTGGIIGASSTLGFLLTPNTTIDTHWAFDTAQQSTSYRTTISGGYFGATLAQLQCPTSQTNATCDEVGVLYDDWDSSVWNFGTSSQLPGLIFGEKIYRDSDGDGVLDEDDAFPYSFSAWQDEDKDGYADFYILECNAQCINSSELILDQFPKSAAASLDTDLDGLPEEWNPECNHTCQANSGLTLDSYPNDTDNDGISNSDDNDDNNDGFVDADADSNGLIDVNNLDQLNAIRFNLNGNARVLEKGAAHDDSGCPLVINSGVLQALCSGYELTSDLDFDTNQDGVMDNNDVFWNEGLGWEAIGTNNAPFSTLFNGNGHTINNLNITRPKSNYIGLFGYVSGENAKISHVGLTGSMMQISGENYVGSIAGLAGEGTYIDQIFSTGVVIGDTHVGGLIGYIKSATLSQSFATGSVSSNQNGGGIFGSAISSTVRDSFASSYVIGTSDVGGIVGSSTSTIQNTYWATDTSKQTSSAGINIASHYFGATLKQLQCPTSPTNSDCTETGALYNSWNNSIWDFDDSNKLPGLIFGNTVYRDSDGDGALDENDAFPYEYAASKDSDQDGYVDFYTAGCDIQCVIDSGLEFDLFPKSEAASIDTDFDGAPDEWNANCDMSCQNNSGLTLDNLIDDSDNDGTPNSEDVDDNNDGVTDADSNSNGLIDINNLEQLNAIRFELSGKGRVLTDNAIIDSSGCPLTFILGELKPLCTGYELFIDLDFDTNQDGLMDENDTYWNDGLGWESLGSETAPFATAFNGDGHVIRNLYINRPFTKNIGLFGYVSGEKSSLSNIGLTGPLMQVIGDDYVGSLVGYLNTKASITKTFNTGTVTGEYYVGGVIGYLSSASLTQSFSTGTVTGRHNVGGLVGRAEDSILSNNFITGFTTGNSASGSIAGYSFSTTITNTYWATDTTKQKLNDGNHGFGYTLTKLQCPTGPDNIACSDIGTIYGDWSTTTWDFGTSNQLPGLIFGDTIYRDSDGDGALDEDDAFPYEYAASQGNNADNIADFYTPGCDARCIIESGLTPDQFPENSAISLDTDLDGLPDSWNTSCGIDCQNNSGITLDSSPNDSDNDGIPNSIDTDDNNDGIRDADADSDGLIEINNLEQLHAIRFNLNGNGRVLIEGTLPDSSGCPAITIEGTMQSLCIGYELSTELDFDTNQDGIMDENDTYWNDGLGWEPIGEYSDAPFTAIFDGNGHVIRNLYISRTDTNYIGLFGYVSGELAELRNTGLTGSLMNIIGNQQVGSLAGRADSNTIINQTFSTGMVSGDSNVGGLVGTFIGLLSQSFTTGNISGNESVGGLAGYFNGTLSESFTTGNMSAAQIVGGLIGTASHSQLTHSYTTSSIIGLSNNVGFITGNSINTKIISTHWATDKAVNILDPEINVNEGYFGDLFAQLRCPIAPNDTLCSEVGSLYDSWNTAVWDFGNNNQLPGLVFGNKIHRDNDGDGALDENDLLPDEFAASQDNDNDGFADYFTPGCDIQCIEDSGLILDQFPTSGAVSLDADLDGLPDMWNSSCNLNCQNNSGLILDSYPDDSDNDGLPNIDDTDDNNDGIIDADADSDGLIDINNLEQLNAIRFDLSGNGRVLTDGAEADNSGCPVSIKAGIKQTLCFGYELTADLDFDTNQDGVMDTADTYWNRGIGWSPIGTIDLPFTTIFEGNGHLIRNLYISPYRKDYVGLFGYVSGESAELRSLGLTGPLMLIRGGDYTGSLAGYLGHGPSVQKVFSTGEVDGYNYVGGLVGHLTSATLTQSFGTGSVHGFTYVGGLIGNTIDSTVSDSFTINNTSEKLEFNQSSEEIFVGGISGNDLNLIIKNTHWKINSDISNSINEASLIESSFGATLAQLQCPTRPTTTRCSEAGTLYDGWNNSIWNFGTEKDLPGLIFGMSIYRDSDGDGVLDHEDSFPYAFSASQDIDGDGYPDLVKIGCNIECLDKDGLIFDQFVGNSAAGKDMDFDGLPDEWAANCGQICQQNSGLVLDLHINDLDNDGISDNDDIDDNGDGVIDADADSDGLIDINNLEQLNAMRFELNGQARVLEDEGAADYSGCPNIVNGSLVQKRCHGYELTQSLDFDTNNDGNIDSNDMYWNEGLGWVPIGSNGIESFAQIFDGKGYSIKNLYINRPEASYIGLFGIVLGDSVILRNIRLTGSLMEVTGDLSVGALVGFATQGAQIKNAFSSGMIRGESVIGGLVGHIETSTITQSFSSSSITANSFAGGLVGGASSSNISNTFSTGSVNSVSQAGGLIGGIEGSNITNSYTTGEVTGDNYAGGLLGQFHDEHEITNSYWATDATTQPNSDGEDEFTGYIGTTLNELKCPTSANNTSCVSNTNMYESWNSNIWHFGNESELPGLIIGDYIYRDATPISIEDWNLENQQFESITPINNAPVIENTNNEARSTGGSGGGSVHLLWWVLLSSGLAATRKPLAR
jgi:hypothetical protein